MGTQWERIRHEIKRQNEEMRREFQAKLEEQNAIMRERLDRQKEAQAKEIEALWAYWRDVIGVSG